MRSLNTPDSFNMRMAMPREKIAPENRTGSKETILLAPTIGNHNFIDLLDIDLIAARNFSSERGAESFAS